MREQFQPYSAKINPVSSFLPARVHVASNLLAGSRSSGYLTSVPPQRLSLNLPLFLLMNNISRLGNRTVLSISHFAKGATKPASLTIPPPGGLPSWPSSFWFRGYHSTSSIPKSSSKGIYNTSRSVTCRVSEARQSQ